MRTRKSKKNIFGGIEQLEKRYAMTGDTVESLYADYYVDSHISFDEMESLIEETKDQGYIGRWEMFSLQRIINNSNMPDYVRYLARQAIMGSEANTFFQGNIPLGNLEVGSSSSQIDMMLDKWFRGKDHPLTGKWYAKYKEVEGNLFVDGVSAGDVRQGRVGDCYLIAGLNSAAENDPEAVQDMFLEVGEDLWVVRWYARISREAHYVTVDNELPVSILPRTFDNSFFASFGRDTRNRNDPNNELWGALAEKSYVQVSQKNEFRGTRNYNHYQMIKGGVVGTVTIQIAKVAKAVHINRRVFQRRWSEQRFIEAVNHPDKTFNVGLNHHLYTITSYDPITKRFHLHNPYGKNHKDLTFAELQSLSRTARQFYFVVAIISGSERIS